MLLKLVHVDPRHRVPRRVERLLLRRSLVRRDRDRQHAIRVVRHDQRRARAHRARDGDARCLPRAEHDGREERDRRRDGDSARATDRGHHERDRDTARAGAQQIERIEAVDVRARPRQEERDGEPGAEERRGDNHVVQRHEEQLAPVRVQAERIERNALQEPEARQSDDAEGERQGRHGAVERRTLPQRRPHGEGDPGGAEAQQRRRDHQESEVVPERDGQYARQGELEEQGPEREEEDSDVGPAKGARERATQRTACLPCPPAPSTLGGHHRRGGIRRGGRRAGFWP